MLVLTSRPATLHPFVKFAQSKYTSPGWRYAEGETTPRGAGVRPRMATGEDIVRQARRTVPWRAARELLANPTIEAASAARENTIGSAGNAQLTLLRRDNGGSP